MNYSALYNMLQTIAIGLNKAVNDLSIQINTTSEWAELIKEPTRSDILEDLVLYNEEEIAQIIQQFDNEMLEKLLLSKQICPNCGSFCHLQKLNGISKFTNNYCESCYSATKSHQSASVLVVESSNNLPFEVSIDDIKYRLNSVYCYNGLYETTIFYRGEGSLCMSSNETVKTISNKYFEVYCQNSQIGPCFDEFGIILFAIYELESRAQLPDERQPEMKNSTTNVLYNNKLAVVEIESCYELPVKNNTENPIVYCETSKIGDSEVAPEEKQKKWFAKLFEPL